MKILVVNTRVPFIEGGAEVLENQLTLRLRECGHEVDNIRLPFSWHPPENIQAQILLSRLIQVSGSMGDEADLVIGLKFPSYYVKHPAKVIWLLHQYRGAYDLWKTQWGDLGDDDMGRTVRQSIINADNNYLPEATRIFCISRTVANRLQRFNGLSSTVLYPPVEDPEEFFCEDYGDYFYFPSRMNTLKRQVLAVEAMQFVRTDTRLVLSGGTDSPEFARELDLLVNKLGLRNRVVIHGHVSRSEQRKLYANARGVVFPPYDEDYGFVTLEAFYSSKGVITCRDSGGPNEFVQEGVTGFSCEPHPQSLADAMDRMAEDPGRARRVGEGALEYVRSLGLAWERVIEALIP